MQESYYRDIFILKTFLNANGAHTRNAVGKNKDNNMIDFNAAPTQDQAKTPAIISDQNPIENFRSAMAQYGLRDTDIIPDGQIHRFGKNLNSYYTTWFVCIRC